MGAIEDLYNQIEQVLPRQVLSADDPVLDTDWNKAVQSISKIFDLVKLVRTWDCPAIGGKYLRFPGGVIGSSVLPEDPAPEDRWESTIWQEIDTFFAGAFFRIAGGDALAFGGGRQDHQFQDHKHGPEAGGFLMVPGSGYWEGASGTRNYLQTAGNTGVASSGNRGGETRPVNYTLKLYRRIA